MTEFIVIAYPTIMDGLVLRWFRTTEDAAEHRSFLSASRNGVELYCDSPPPSAVVDANKVLALLKACRDEDARQFVTHRFTRFMGSEIVPVQRVGDRP